jgi:hypothetical protein
MGDKFSELYPKWS